MYVERQGCSRGVIHLKYEDIGGGGHTDAHKGLPYYTLLRFAHVLLRRV